MDFIPQWVMGYFIIPGSVLFTYIFLFKVVFYCLEKMCKRTCSGTEIDWIHIQGS